MDKRFCITKFSCQCQNAKLANWKFKTSLGRDVRGILMVVDCQKRFEKGLRKIFK